jgi:hypothetical protein
MVTTVVVRGEVQIQSFTLGFTVAGERNNWTVVITSPGGIKTEDTTVERTWFPLFSEMLSEAYHSAQKKRFPERQVERMPS